MKTQTDADLTSDDRAFLEGHHWAVLSTGRRDGSPQVSMVGYACDGDDLVVALRRTSAKYNNIVRQPSVALLVPDGDKGLSLYGTATIHETDPERVGAMRSIVRSFGMEPPADELLAAGMDESGRVMVRIRPVSVQRHNGPAGG